MLKCSNIRFAQLQSLVRGRRGETMNDPIVDEVRRIKNELAARFNYDLKAIYDHLKQREKEREEKTGRKFVSYPPRRVEPAAVPQARPTAAALPAGTTLPEEVPSR
jgi:hypothetical protein